MHKKVRVETASARNLLIGPGIMVAWVMFLLETLIFTRQQVGV